MTTPERFPLFLGESGASWRSAFGIVVGDRDEAERGHAPRDGRSGSRRRRVRRGSEVRALEERGPPICSEKVRCSCRAARWPIRSPCCCTHARVTKSSSASGLTASGTNPARARHGAACNSRSQVEGGLFTAEDVERAIKPRSAYLPNTSLVALENRTTARAAGIVRLDKRGASRRWRARRLGVAPRWRAPVERRGRDRRCDARLRGPVRHRQRLFLEGSGRASGSALAGSAELIIRAHRYRKMLGGGMRQSGVLTNATACTRSITMCSVSRIPAQSSPLPKS